MPTTPSSPRKQPRRRSGSAPPARKPAERLKEIECRLAEVRLRRLRLQKEVVRAKTEPGYLLDRVGRMVDEKTGEAFQFHLTDPDHAWYWQREVYDELGSVLKAIILKARQLGITWLCAGKQLETALLVPGTLHLIYRQKEDDSAEIVARIWEMFQSLPDHLRFGVTVMKPARGRPHLEIELRHPDGRLSRIHGKASTESEGHGDTAATVLIDEAARIEKLRGIWKAITSTVGTKGRVWLVSTANGVSNPQTGEGNFFHRLWATAEERGLAKIFLGWFKHPDRDQDWYENSSEIRALDAYDRAEQYPSNEHEAFELTTDVYFDRDALTWYASEALAQPLYRFQFEKAGPRLAKREVQARGWIRVYEEPNAEHAYAIAADVATGRGADSSAAYVVDLSTMALVAELHGKLDVDLYALQLHYLGKWYRDALIAVETSAGHGEAVIVALKDGREGRPPYPKLYRHVRASRTDQARAKAYGYPINQKTRPVALSQLEKAIRDRQLPWMTAQLLAECQTFVHRDTGTTPRAQDGASDDCVMAAAIVLELYRQRGHHPEREARRRSRKRKPAQPLYPWQEPAPA